MTHQRNVLFSFTSEANITRARLTASITARWSNGQYIYNFRIILERWCFGSQEIWISLNITHTLISSIGTLVLLIWRKLLGEFTEKRGFVQNIAWRISRGIPKQNKLFLVYWQFFIALVMVHDFLPETSWTNWITVITGEVLSPVRIP